MLNYRIAAFGCWNNRYNKRNKTIKDDSDVYLNLVMESLKYFEINYQDLIILGDNYYPLKNKDKKKDKSKDEKKEGEKKEESKGEKKEESTLTKYFNIFGGGEGDKPKVKANTFVKEDIEYGFNKLININIKNKYLIMGNHDIEDFIECDGLKYQLDLKNINIMFPFKSKDVIVNVNGVDYVYKYIFIDTSLFNIKDTDDPNIMPCFVNSGFNYGVQYTNSKEILIAQSNFLRDELNKDGIKHFLIFGHEPIFSLKTKVSDEGKLKDKTSCLNKLADIIFDNMRSSNITYICADVHMFQIGKITTNIKNPDKFITQIVVGTGGAELDDCIECDDKNSELNFDSQIYRYHIRITDKSFGFLDIILDGSPELKYDYFKLGYQHDDLSAFRKPVTQTGGGNSYKIKLNTYNISNFV
jgi:hypothetical protein